jgi:hypothetical protein
VISANQGRNEILFLSFSRLRAFFTIAVNNKRRTRVAEKKASTKQAMMGKEEK